MLKIIRFVFLLMNYNRVKFIFNGFKSRIITDLIFHCGAPNEVSKTQLLANTANHQMAEIFSFLFQLSCVERTNEMRMYEKEGIEHRVHKLVKGKKVEREKEGKISLS